MTDMVYLVTMFFVHCAYAHGPSQIERFSETNSQFPLTRSRIQDALLSYMCNGENGTQCSGRGNCYMGSCSCNLGFTGSRCEIQIGGETNANITEITDHLFQNWLQQSGFHSLSTVESEMATFRSEINAVEVTTFSGTERKTVSPLTACRDAEGGPCNGHGVCRYGICECEPGYSGFRCEVSHSVGFCNTYRECAECTAFMESCPAKCSNMAQFNLVYGFPSTVSSGFRKCRFRSAERRCSFYYMQESESPQGWKTIMVKPCLSEIKDLVPETSSEAPVVESITSVTTETYQSSTTQVVTKSRPDYTPYDAGHADREAAGPKGTGSDSHANMVLVLGSFMVLMNI